MTVPDGSGDAKSIGRVYVATALVLAFAAAGLGYIAEADYIYSIIPSFIPAAAKLGALLAAALLAGVCAVSLLRAGRLPGFGDCAAGFLLSAAALVVLAPAFIATTNSWLDKSPAELKQTTVERRWDKPHRTGRNRDHSAHDAYVYLAPWKPGMAAIRLPGDYSSTNGLKAGDRFGVYVRKGFWGLEHAGIGR